MPTLLKNFTTLFEPKIIERGKAYFKNGDVLNLRNDYDNHWTGIVKGNERYRVEVELSKNGWGDIFINQLDCTCEYWDNCKHMVAVLMKLQNAVQTVHDVTPETVPTFHEQLNHLEKLQLIELIEHFNNKYVRLEEDFLLWLNKKGLNKSDENLNQNNSPTDRQISKIIQHRINEILTFDDSNEWEEFVFDEQLQALEDLLKEFDHQPHYQQEIALTWIDVALATFDDLYDEVGDSLQICFAVLGKYGFSVDDYHATWQANFIPVQCVADNDFIQKISILADQWRLAKPRQRYIASEEIERFWFDFLWGLKQQDEAIKWLDYLLTQAEKYGSYDRDSLLKFKMQLWQYLGKDSQDIINENLHFPKIRQLKIDEAIRNQDFSQAIALLKEGIATTNITNLTTDWYEQLVKIGEQTQDIAFIREYSEILAFNAHFLDERHLRIWKNTFAKDEWHKVREQAQANLLKAKNFTLLAKFYQLENQQSELVNLLKRLEEKYLVDTYAKTIAEHDMIWLIDFSRKSWSQRIENLSNRHEYHAFAQEIVQAIRQFPQGKSAWLASVQDWITQFSTKTASRGRKPALVEELSKILV